MTYNEVVKHYGTCAKAARALGTARQTVHGWKTRGGIPFEWQYRMQLASNGKLKAKLSK